MSGNDKDQYIYMHYDLKKMSSNSYSRQTKLIYFWRGKQRCPDFSMEISDLVALTGIPQSVFFSKIGAADLVALN